MPVVGLGARRGSDALLGIAAAHPDATIGVAEPTESERRAFSDALGDRVRFGPSAMEELATTSEAAVVNGIVGAAGLPASVAALGAGNRLCLANKESLVAGGPVVAAALAEGGGELIPVDSEHSALWQCLVGEPPGAVRRLILTASGGPFRGRSIGELADVTVVEALAHPTWDMGPRITVDSATLMNKAFEVIEAHYLFGVGYDRIDVVVHPTSEVHSLVEFVDGSLKAELGRPDMRGPIQYALTYPDRAPLDKERLDLVNTELVFTAPDLEAFPALRLGYAAGRAGGSAPAVLNAADEVAVHAFLEGRIGFLTIAAVVEATLEAVDGRELRTVDEVLEVDAEARNVAAAIVAGGSR